MPDHDGGFASSVTAGVLVSVQLPGQLSAILALAANGTRRVDGLSQFEGMKFHVRTFGVGHHGLRLRLQC